MDELRIETFRNIVQHRYREPFGSGDFGEILCYEIHSQPINPRMEIGRKGLTFGELAQKWGISVSFLGELIADHCKKLDQ